MKVLLIEDGDIGRLGRKAAMETGGHEVVALRWSDLDGESTTDQPACDALLAVLTPDTSTWDRYPMLATLASLGDAQGPGVTTIAVLDAEAADNPLIGLRLHRAGVDSVVTGAAIRTVEDMCRVISEVTATAPARPSDNDLRMVGVGPEADPDAVVSWVADRLRGPLADEYRNAFDPGVTQAASGLSRRQARTLRVRLSALGKICPNPSHSGGGPVRDRSLPRWTEVIGVANLCRGLSVEEDEARGVGGGRTSAWRAA